ncbi:MULTISPECIES: GGDEF domain-containing protein [unclassified Butyrivibrio]|uniref:GGDEF domain-containing protein n=1 Tax=unclassified Butyrivibrio TaxID=2639466 RepID=UPI0003B74FBB|nr:MULTISPECIES: GGDEF domain-containing protein [unclassified Butyrivibrio]
MKKRFGLLARFTIIFLLFMIIMIVISAVATYMIQEDNYTLQQERRIKEVTNCLEALIEADGDEFRLMQEYFLENHESIVIPYDYDGNYIPARNEWERIFSEQYGGEVFEKTIAFSDMTDEAKIAFTTYKYEQWLNIFEEFNEEFGTEYVYYLVPTDTPPLMYYVFDGLRTEKVVDGKSIMEFDFDVEVPEDSYPKLWETYQTGKSPSGYDSYDNQFGKTYGYYTPLYVSGEMIGIVCADITVEAVNKGILNNTIKEVVIVAVILLLCMYSMLWFINHQYILKLRKMEKFMDEYADNKEVSTADKFDNISLGNHEITNLARRTAAMIRELNDYMLNLMKTSKELHSTKEHAAEMAELAHKDALTGIRNKTAYDKEIIKLDRELRRNPDVEFAIAMIDLNFLKRINDNYGHEQGNIAIKRLCDIVCKIFCHSPVFRLGGDEFAVVLWGSDFNNKDALLNEFANKLKEMEKDDTLKPWEKISAAIGLAVYSPGIDENVSDVFKRADSMMYENKKEMRATRD